MIFVDTAEWPEEIDANRAEDRRRLAAEQMMAHQSGMEYARARAALERAMARLAVKRSDW
jgi:F-type H+-transporting ATPase subunit epsilon